MGFICSPPAAASLCYMNLSQNDAQWEIILPEYYWSVIWVPGSIPCRHRCERDNLHPLTPQIFQRVLSFRYINLQAFHSSFVTKSMPLILLLGFFSKPGMSQYPWIISWSCFESCWYPCTGPRGLLTQPGWAGRFWREGASFFLFLSFFPHWLRWDLVGAQ